MVTSRVEGAGYVRRLFRKVGVDRVVAMQVAQRAWTAAALPVTLLLLSHQLSTLQQGIYYSFGSVQALSVVFEAGLAYVLTQFAAHEQASRNDPERGAAATARLSSLLHFGLKWNGCAALLCLLLLAPFGYLFFRDTPGIEGTPWIVPWLIFATASASLLTLAPLYAVLEGTGHLADTSRIRFFQSIFSTLVLWGGLVGGFGLLALAGSQVIALCASLGGLMWLRGGTLRKIWNQRSDKWQINYWTEIWPMHWKVALSWLAGYVAFYFTTPLVFKALSPAEAGQYGMTANLLLSATNIASIWVYSKAPRFGQMVAAGDVGKMRSEFNLAMLRSCLVLLGGLAALGLAVWVYPLLHLKISLFERLLKGPVLLLIAISMFFMHVYGLLNVYFRAFKGDPLFFISVGSAAGSALLLVLVTPGGNLAYIVLVPLCFNVAACLFATWRYVGEARRVPGAARH